MNDYHNRTYVMDSDRVYAYCCGSARHCINFDLMHDARRVHVVISSLDVSAGCSRPVAIVTQLLSTLVIGNAGEYEPSVMRISDGDTVLQHGMSCIKMFLFCRSFDASTPTVSLSRTGTVNRGLMLP